MYRSLSYHHRLFFKRAANREVSYKQTKNTINTQPFSSTAQDFLSSRVRRQPPNPFAPLVPLMKDPRNCILAQGVPPMEIFPISGMSVTLSDGTKIELSDNEVVSSQRLIEKKYVSCLLLVQTFIYSFFKN
jgi:hypothetical protein